MVLPGRDVTPREGKKKKKNSDPFFHRNFIEAAQIFFAFHIPFGRRVTGGCNTSISLMMYVNSFCHVHNDQKSVVMCVCVYLEH
jgi:hypothetical protein